MHFQIQQTRIGQLIGQRNNALLVIASLVFIAIIQGVTIFHLVDFQKMNFTPVPQVITTPFSISRAEVSSGYLADMSRYFAMLRLNFTPATFASQARWLLRYTDASFYGQLKQALAEEQAKVVQHDFSFSFSPTDTQVNVKKLQVVIRGDLVIYIGKTRLTPKQVRYQMNYSYNNGVLRVTQMKQLKGSSDDQ